MGSLEASKKQLEVSWRRSEQEGKLDIRKSADFFSFLLYYSKKNRGITKIIKGDAHELILRPCNASVFIFLCGDLRYDYSNR